MTDIDQEPVTRDIIVEEVLPHAPEKVWTVLTTSSLIDRWLMVNDFRPVLGHRFTFKDRPRGDWNGIVDCEVLEIDPPRKLVYSWIGGSADGPDSPPALDSVVTWTLNPVEGGTRLKLVHSGFRSPENDIGYEAMGSGWTHILPRIGELAGQLT